MRPCAASASRSGEATQLTASRVLICVINAWLFPAHFDPLFAACVLTLPPLPPLLPQAVAAAVRAVALVCQRVQQVLRALLPQPGAGGRGGPPLLQAAGGAPSLHGSMRFERCARLNACAGFQCNIPPLCSPYACRRLCCTDARSRTSSCSRMQSACHVACPAWPPHPPLQQRRRRRQHQRQLGPTAAGRQQGHSSRRKRQQMHQQRLGT